MFEKNASKLDYEFGYGKGKSMKIEIENVLLD